MPVSLNGPTRSEIVSIKPEVEKNGSIEHSNDRPACHETAG